MWAALGSGSGAPQQAAPLETHRRRSRPDRTVRDRREARGVRWLIQAHYGPFIHHCGAACSPATLCSAARVPVQRPLNCEVCVGARSSCRAG